MGKRAKIGDVIEIETAKGLAYAQYTHEHPTWGALIRILPGLYKKRPPKLDDLVGKKALYVIFFPVGAAVNQKIFEIVERTTVPQEAREFPIFRSGNAHPETGKVGKWWFWDGGKSWEVGKITPEQRKMPMREIWNDTMLIDRIEEGWTPETDSE